MKNYRNYCTMLVTLLASATITTAGGPAMAADQPAAETKNATVIRVGIAPPVNQLDAANQIGSTPMRDLFAQYLKGPGVEIVPLEAMLPQQTDAEAKQKNCQYVIYATLTQKRGSGGMAFMRGATAMSSIIPVVGMAGGMAGAIASTAASAAVNSASSLSGTVKAKSDVSLDYKVFTPGAAAPVLANILHMKAKQDGQDVITPLVAQANTEILAKMTQK